MNTYMMMLLIKFFISLVFLFFGFLHISTPVSELEIIFPWASLFSDNFSLFIGAIDLLGGLGLLLPVASSYGYHIFRLCVIGCLIKQAVAVWFHLSIGDVQIIPLNLVVILGLAFILSFSFKEVGLFGGLSDVRD